MSVFGITERSDGAVKCFISVSLFAAGQRTSVSFFGEYAFFIENLLAGRWHFGCVVLDTPCVGGAPLPSSLGGR